MGLVVMGSFREALAGFRQYRLWVRLGWNDLLARYRRSWLGPIWLALTAAVFVGALGVVYGSLFNTDLEAYLPIVATGLPIWNFISGTASESVLTFVESETYVRQIRMNYFVYVFRVMWRNILVFFNQIIISLLVVGWFGTTELWLLSLFALGVMLLFLQALWVVPLLGVLGARFRDLQPLLQNVLLILFLVTPIFWSPQFLGDRTFIIDFNPVHHLISVVREPLLGRIPSLINYSVVLVGTFIGTVVAAHIYAQFRNRIVYWL